MRTLLMASVIAVIAGCHTRPRGSDIAVSSSPGHGHIIALTTYDHSPLPGVDVHLVRGAAHMKCTTDCEGRCSGEVSSGQWSVSVELTGMLPAQMHLTVAPDTDVTIRAGLVPAKIEAITIYEPEPPPGPGEFRIWQAEADKLPIAPPN